tara:strand:- start:124 stop:408 length:285 start_codon:yes stop_codon:yes gene_type:complete
MRADKVRKTDSVWDDDRIQNFLNRPSMGQETGDYSRLLFAYRSIRRKDYWRSVEALVKTESDVNSKNNDGLTFAPQIKAHLKSAAFINTSEHCS